MAAAHQIFNDATHRSHRYLWGPGTDQLIAYDQQTGDEETKATAWALADRQGTVSDYISRAGGDPSVLWLIQTGDSFGLPGRKQWTSYYAFATANVGPQFFFAGQQFDPETGLQYSRARYYDPFAAQFTAQDPSGMLGRDFNPYRRANNSPANATDPTGLANLWNIYTWGIADPDQSWGDFFNPYAESNTYSEIRAGFNSGLLTGFKANTNAVADTAVSFATLGHFTGQDVGLHWQETASDRDNGYELSYVLARGSFELLLGNGVGKLAQLPGYVGKAALLIDYAGNVSGASRGLVQMALDGPNADNVSQVFFAGMGISGNVVGLKNAWRASVIDTSTVDLVRSRVTGNGRLGGVKLTAKEVDALEEEVRSWKVGLLRNAGYFLKKIHPDTCGGFSWNKDDSVARLLFMRGVTFYEAFHEVAHARQWRDLGPLAFHELGTYERELYVYNEIMKNKNLFNKRELDHAEWYIDDIYTRFGEGRSKLH